MRTRLETDFTAPMLTEPIDYFHVEEGQFAVAPFTPNKPHHIATLNLYTCKGITIYDPENKRGLVAPGPSQQGF